MLFNQTSEKQKRQVFLLLHLHRREGFRWRLPKSLCPPWPLLGLITALETVASEAGPSQPGVSTAHSALLIPIQAHSLISPCNQNHSGSTQRSGPGLRDRQRSAAKDTFTTAPGSTHYPHPPPNSNCLLFSLIYFQPPSSHRCRMEESSLVTRRGRAVTVHG